MAHGMTGDRGARWLLLWLSGTALALADEAKLPEGAVGLAARYPGDAGIEKDAEVVFAENFETPSIETLKSRWDQVNTQLTSLANEAPAASSGKKSILFTHIGGQGEGGHLYKSFKTGYERLFLRLYVKFAPDCGPIHHFVHLGGYSPPTPWPQGGAGLRPQGRERFTTGVEPYGDAWKWDFYTYWMEMRGSPPRGQCWGNSFLGADKPKVERGKIK